MLHEAKSNTTLYSLAAAVSANRTLHKKMVETEDAARKDTLEKRDQMEGKRDAAREREPGKYECRKCGIVCPSPETIQAHNILPCKFDSSEPLWRAMTATET
mmetsp:Transcript_35784/g.30085  ORF Transcript_35784/g.30085 Transcript_35784/m.30085 type:complete len:102 (-) Transcript_35784:208-513(-)